MKVRVIYEGGIQEDGKLYLKGDIFETTLERAKGLGDSVEIIEEIEKALDSPPKDKMIRRAKKK